MDYNSILGVVLAGGQSKRFGQDKSQVQLESKILIDYILLEILNEFNEILIIANNDIKFFNSKKIKLKIIKKI
jgi:molybdopterin-guanine dinucleotide biosynthesis protein A